MRNLYIGLISGTSMDGIDAVLVEFADSPDLLHVLQYDYPADLQQQLSDIKANPAATSIDDIGELHSRIGKVFRDAALELLRAAKIGANDVRAIGSHGQTVRHRPDVDHPYSLQLGDPAIIAAGTGIDTVADFRSMDMALGGQGAPLLPPFHDWLFRSNNAHRVIVNIGGIANVTMLPAGRASVTGFDTGPGNTLMDAWTRWHNDERFDADGKWAASGKVDNDLLQRLLSDPWFDAPPPKSTGFEHFNLSWLSAADDGGTDPADVQATLCELTATSIANAIRSHAPKTQQVFVCGGGAHNRHLLERLKSQLGKIELDSTAAAGIDPDWVEAAAFAWLAMRRVNDEPGNVPGVTGASRAATLGALYRAPNRG